jgi:hypothetical protein
MPAISPEGLFANPFAILGATTRDDCRRILEMAERKSLELDEEVCRNAEAALTNSRPRLGAELAWLPGVSPKRALQLLALLANSPRSVRAEAGLPRLTQLNLMADAWNSVDANDTPTDLSKFLIETARLIERLSPEEVQRDINEDRIVSGFPEVRNLNHIETALLERVHHCRSRIGRALKRLTRVALVSTMTKAVEQTTETGRFHAPAFIDDLVDGYAWDLQSLLEATCAKVDRVLVFIRTSRTSEEVLMGYIERLEVMVRRWSKIARPIRLSAMSRGMEHEPSIELANSVRNAAIRLDENRGMRGPSLRMLTLIQELFADIPEIDERVTGDLAQLDRKEAESALIRQWNSIITKGKAAVARAEEEPMSANREAIELIAARAGLVVSEAVPLKVRIRSRNAYATSLERLADLFGNHTEDWASCVPLYSEALKCVWDDEIGRRIQERLSSARGQAKLRQKSKLSPTGASLPNDCGIATTPDDSLSLEGMTDRDQVTLRNDQPGFIGSLPEQLRSKWKSVVSVATIVALVVASLYSQFRALTRFGR